MPKRCLAVLFLSLVIFATHTDAQSEKTGGRKFDEFGDVYVTDIKARADNFAIELQNNPMTKGFIIVYRSRRDLPGLSFRYADRIREYLVSTRGITEDRIVAVDGGESQCLMQELWIVPPNTAPTPRPDAYKRNFDDVNAARKFDEIPIGEEQGLTLTGFADALLAEPRSRAYLIAYAQYYVERGSFEDSGKRVHYKRVYLDPRDTASKLLNQARRTLIDPDHISASRIRLVDGGYRQQPALELWIVPLGEHAPIPTPNSFPHQRPRKKQ